MDEHEYKEKQLTAINNLTNEELLERFFSITDAIDFGECKLDYMIVYPYPSWLYNKLKKELKIRLRV